MFNLEVDFRSSSYPKLDKKFTNVLTTNVRLQFSMFDANRVSLQLESSAPALVVNQLSYMADRNARTTVFKHAHIGCHHS